MLILVPKSPKKCSFWSQKALKNAHFGAQNLSKTVILVPKPLQNANFETSQKPVKIFSQKTPLKMPILAPNPS